MPKVRSRYKDLFDVIPQSLAAGHDYCGEFYWQWEDLVAKPALEAAGYERVTFHMGERDSFGPLSRIVRAYKGGACHEFIYS
jgi:hypothetical protein